MSMRNTIKCLFIVLALAAAMGCGKKGGGSGVAAPAPFNPWNPGGVPPVTPPLNPVDPDAGGASTELIPISKGRFDNYLGYTSNAPTDIKVSVSLTLFNTITRSSG